MNLRQLAEEKERRFLSPHAVLSSASRGREKPEPECSVRTAFQRDRDRIIHSKAFRRLKYKTQVFISPEGDHFRTRLTHTLEVTQIARTIARALGLNEDLTEAIALGHDLGHTPFGHAGEEALNDVFPPGFKHNEQSLRTVDVLEQGRGLNLTWEVRDGILNHTGPGLSPFLEGQIVKISDRIAYINHDIDDAIRAEIIKESQLPQDCLEILGREHRVRINTMVMDIIQQSWDQPRIAMSKEIQEAMDRLRSFLFANVYIGSAAKLEEEKAKGVVRELYRHLTANPHLLPEEWQASAARDGVERAAVDYIAGMTDRYALKVFEKFFLPLPWLQEV